MLQLDYTDPDTSEHLAASYWKVTGINFQPEIFTSHIVLSGYKDVDAYNAGKRPFMVQEMDIVQNPLDETITVGAAIAGVYVYAQAAIGFFATATIV